MEGRRRRRFPSKEELELWVRVTRHDEPLARARAAAPADPEPPTAATAREERPPPSCALLTRDATPGNPAKSPANPVPPPQPFDPRAAKRIARGRREIDARLDLHGLRQHDAHAALRRFLAHCQSQGYRHVLIITGKGADAEREETGDFWSSEQRGVLRRLVPHWLSEPSMRLHVVSYTESALKHGGSGALYVTIRKGPPRARVALNKPSSAR
ncbi:MAG: Smr/MutS family protein [Rhodomicrobium sp.]